MEPTVAVLMLCQEDLEATMVDLLSSAATAIGGVLLPTIQNNLGAEALTSKVLH